MNGYNTSSLAPRALFTLTWGRNGMSAWLGIITDPCGELASVSEMSISSLNCKNKTFAIALFLLLQFYVNLGIRQEKHFSC